MKERTRLAIILGIWIAFLAGWYAASSKPIQDGRAIQIERDSLDVMLNQNAELQKACEALPAGDTKSDCGRQVDDAKQILADFAHQIGGAE